MRLAKASALRVKVLVAQKRLFATRGAIERAPGIQSLICDGCGASIPARTTAVSVVGADVDFCVECMRTHWPCPEGEQERLFTEAAGLEVRDVESDGD